MSILDGLKKALGNDDIPALVQEVREELAGVYEKVDEWLVSLEKKADDYGPAFKFIDDLMSASRASERDSAVDEKVDRGPTTSEKREQLIDFYQRKRLYGSLNFAHTANDAAIDQRWAYVKEQGWL